MRHRCEVRYVLAIRATNRDEAMKYLSMVQEKRKEKAKKTNMKTCPNCGKVEGGHSSILQGCVCQYSMQAPPQRTWQGLTDEDISEIVRGTHNTGSFVRAIESKLIFRF